MKRREEKNRNCFSCHCTRKIKVKYDEITPDQWEHWETTQGNYRHYQLFRTVPSLLLRPPADCSSPHPARAFLCCICMEFTCRYSTMGDTMGSVTVTSPTLRLLSHFVHKQPSLLLNDRGTVTFGNRSGPCCITVLVQEQLYRLPGVSAPKIKYLTAANNTF